MPEPLTPLGETPEEEAPKTSTPPPETSKEQGPPPISVNSDTFNHGTPIHSETSAEKALLDLGLPSNTSPTISSSIAQPVHTETTFTGVLPKRSLWETLKEKWSELAPGVEDTAHWFNRADIILSAIGHAP